MGEPSENRQHPMSRDAIELMVERMLDKQIEAMESRLKAHADARFDELKGLIRSAVPDGDVHAHLQAHREMIKQSVARAERWSKIWDRILVGGAYSLAAAVALGLWDVFKASLNK